MPKRLKDNAQVVHYWAHAMQPEGYVENLAFEPAGNSPADLKLKSYGAVIAWRIADLNGQPFVVHSTRKHSVTTSSHQHKARVAASHLPNWEVPVRLDQHDAPNTVVGLADVLLPLAEYCETQLASAFVGVKQVASAHKLNAVYALCAEYRDHVEKSAPLIAHVTVRPEYANADTELSQWRIDRLDRALAKWRAIADTIDLERAELEALPKIQALRARMAERERQQEAERALKAEQDKIDTAQKLELWRAGEYTGWINSPYAYLRFDAATDTVRTSKGVQMPADEARLALKFWRAGRLTGKRVAGFVVTIVSADTQTVIAGCHTVPFSELEALETALGVVPEQAA